MPERQSTDDNNPFAPPPEGRPDQPWQPRRPEDSDDGSGSQGSPDGRWSPRQPGPSDDGFGRGPERQDGGQGGPGQGGPGQGGGGQGGGGRQGMRWDPTDPAQRRARYAILSGMWAFFFAIFEIPELALLLGALGLYWAISALRAGPKATAPEPSAEPAPSAPGQGAGQPQTPSRATQLRSMRTAAISGLVAASVALMIVAVGFTMKLVYRDFYECRDDALTHAGQLACNDLLPKPLRAGFGVRE
ncbi:hypothetical protein ACIRQY_05485 [Streptomyces sp. NPDC101490]|uniref:hypothetical protein n=1 Tax=unclassified Streptomyces TaxID=2593676 RepID=UPI003318FBF5